jgi:hypothetical protein
MAGQNEINLAYSETVICIQRSDGAQSHRIDGLTAEQIIAVKDLVLYFSVLTDAAVRGEFAARDREALEKKLILPMGTAPRRVASDMPSLAAPQEQTLADQIDTEKYDFNPSRLPDSFPGILGDH